MKQLRIRLAELMMRKLWIATRTQIESAVVPGSGGIALVGDSITHLGKWDLLFPDVPIRNFGIAGERSSHLLERVGPVVALKPQKLFLLIGANDLGVGIAIEETAGNVAALLDRYRRELPECAIHLHSVMPRARKFAVRVKALNLMLREVAQQRGVAFIDVSSVLDDGTGALRVEFSLDELHLNGAGYLAWREVLRPYLLDGKRA